MKTNDDPSNTQRVPGMARPRGAQREHITRTSGRLFRDKGYHGTSMADIATEVGLSKAALYTHLSAKQDVLRELVDRGATLFMDGIAEVAASTDPAPTKLRHALRMHLGIVAGHPDLAAVFLQEWRQLDGDARDRINRLRDQYEHTWRAIIAQGTAEGTLRPTLDPRIAALAFLSIANWAYQWLHARGPLPADTIADHFATLLLAGMQVED
jgi:AcrR family transcriptional regulator